MECEASQAGKHEAEDKITEEKFLNLPKKFIRVKQMAAQVTLVTKWLNLFIPEVDREMFL